MKDAAPHVNILIADDHRLFRTAVRTILSRVNWITVVGDVEDGVGAFRACLEPVAPDVILMDVHMPRCNGRQATARVRECCSDTQVLLLTTGERERDLFPAIKAGALGYAVKTADPSSLIASICEVYRRNPVLTPELASWILRDFTVRQVTASMRTSSDLTELEKRILNAIGEGQDQAHVAEALQLSATAVTQQLRDVFAKLHGRLAIGKIRRE
jgi:DNA-binding NarL/FixJ family response regulator